MKQMLLLIKGELIRMVKYMILPVSTAISLLWVILFLLLSASESLTLAPLFIFTDVALMSIIFIGASHHFEKQEGTIKSMMMMPVSIGEIIVSKALAAMVMALESTVVVILGLGFIHGIWVDVGPLLLYVVVSSLAHVAIGFTLSLLSRDFTAMLGLLMGYMLVFAIPTIFYTFEIIPQRYGWMLWISPSHVASNLISGTISEVLGALNVIGGLTYLIMLAAVLFRFAVFPRFKSHAVRG